MTPRRGLMVTGTDTGVGKTRIAVGLCRAFAAAGYRVAAMKPVASGCIHTADGLRNEDALALHAAMSVAASYDDVNPFAFEPAIAPHIAAAETGRPIELRMLDASFERLSAASDIIIVEGAGGWRVPLDATVGFADLASRWELDVVLVVGLRVGCLSHALLTVESISRQGRRLGGWVGNQIVPEFERRAANLRTLEERIDAPCIGDFSYVPSADGETIAPSLRIERLEMDLPRLA